VSGIIGKLMALTHGQRRYSPLPEDATGAVRCASPHTRSEARRGAPAVLLLTCALGLGLSRSAHASEDRFEWDAPAGCPNAARVLLAVSSLLGPEPLDFGPYQRISGRVERVAGDWHLSLELVEGTRRRSRVIMAPTCSDLAQAAGVAIALALDATAAPGAGDARSREHDRKATRLELASSAQPPKDADAARAQTSSLQSEAVTAPSDGSSGAIMIGGETLLDMSALPKPAFGLQLSAGWQTGRGELSAYGLLLPTQSDSAGSSGVVEFSLLAAGLRARYELARGVVDVAGSAGVELGGISSKGEGLVDAGAFTNGWLAPNLDLDLGTRISGGWSWRATGGALLPLYRPQYRINGDESVHRPSALGLRVAFGVFLALD
jgi:hypothetical protein